MKMRNNNFIKDDGFQLVKLLSCNCFEVTAMLHLTFKILFCLVVVSVSDAAGTKQPNIVFILADDLGFRDVGFRGADIETPNIDKLAKDGVILDNYYVQPICTPSRSQLMTGRYQIHTGLQHSVIFAPQRLCLPLDEVTLPEKLKEVGYSTHIVGKWHLGFYRKECLPTSRGFDTHYGYYCGNQDYYTKNVCGAFGGWKNSGKYCALDFHINGKPDHAANGTYSTYLYGNKAAEIIFEHDRRKPMFLYLPFQSVHFPLQAPDSYVNKYLHIKDKNRRIYSAMVTAMDDAIGSVVQALTETGMIDNTVIVFSSDNGGQTLFGGSNYPLRGRKASLWEGGVRGVGVVHGAGIKNPGRMTRELMHVSDWFPTLIHIAGGTTLGTKPLDSHNVWDAIAEANVSSPRTELLHNIDPRFRRPYGPTPQLKPFPNKHGIDTMKGHTALRMGNWKLVTGDPGHDAWDPVPSLYKQMNVDFSCLTTPSNDSDCGSNQISETSSVRLFDIETDPEERHNVADFFPSIVDKMLEKLAQYNTTVVPINWPEADDECNPAYRDDVWGPWVL